MSLNGLLRTCVHAEAPTYEARARIYARANALIACGQHASKQERLTTETARTHTLTQYLKQIPDAEQGEPVYRVTVEGLGYRIWYLKQIHDTKQGKPEYRRRQTRGDKRAAQE
jgi:hypothetical protein